MYTYTDSKSVGKLVNLCTWTVYVVPYWLLHICDCKRILEPAFDNWNIIDTLCFITVLCSMDTPFS